MGMNKVNKNKNKNMERKGKRNHWKKKWEGSGVVVQPLQADGGFFEPFGSPETSQRREGGKQWGLVLEQARVC